MPQSIPLSVVNGDTPKIPFVIKIDGELADLTAYKIWFTIKKTIDDTDEATTTIQKTKNSGVTTGTGITIEDYDDNGVVKANALILVAMTKEETRSIEAGKEYPYDMQIEHPDGEIETVIISTIKAGKDATISTTIS